VGKETATQVARKRWNFIEEAKKTKVLVFVPQRQRYKKNDIIEYWYMK
jgi:hypothetical protein